MINKVTAALAVQGIALCAAIAYASHQKWSEIRAESSPPRGDSREEQLKSLEQRYSVSQSNQPDDWTQDLDRLSNLALVSWQLGHFQLSEKALNQAVTIARKRWGASDPHCAVFLATLASVYRDDGKLKEAQEAAQEVLSIDTKAFGAGSAYVARDLNNAGLLYFVDALNQSDENKKRELLATSRKYYEKSTGITARLKPFTAPVGSTAVNMVSQLKEEGRTYEALSLHRTIEDNRKFLKRYQSP